MNPRRRKTPQSAAATPAPVITPPHTKKKLFVLDTNVLMHDPMSLFSFNEHDVFLPITTLEEFDNNKKGKTEVARNVRQATRIIDQMLEESKTDIKKGVSLKEPSYGSATGNLIIQVEEMNGEIPDSFPRGKGDHQILSVMTHLVQAEPYKDYEVILVTKDLNMRIKARVLGIKVEDYLSDKVIEDADLLYTGMHELPADFWETHGENVLVKTERAHTAYQVRGPLCDTFQANELVYSDGLQFEAIVHEVSPRSAVLHTTVVDYSHQKHSVFGITARNREQNFALNLLMDPNIDFVTLLGQAGTGKTLLALAAGLAQTLDTKRFAEIIMTRVTVPIGEDIGFLPGTEEDKMAPWMGAMEDNLDVLIDSTKDKESNCKENGHHKETHLTSEWARSATRDLIGTHVKVKSLNFMRGRTFLNKFVIIDEAQNLTPKQMKALITRAGPGTKMVCLGNLTQIDTPYLTEGTSGLAYVVDRFKGWNRGGHVILTRGERSPLADYANEVL
jgi:PhoH-like ATPase